MATLSLPIGINNYLMTRALGALSRACCGLATRVCGMVDCRAMTGTVITCKTLS